jgi:hypothetical protein
MKFFVEKAFQFYRNVVNLLSQKKKCPQTSKTMRKISFQTKKWAVRAMLAAGTMLGLSSCFHSKNDVDPNPPETVYGPPPEFYDNVDPVEDVYGPPIEEFDTTAIKSQDEPAVPEPKNPKKE